MCNSPVINPTALTMQIPTLSVENLKIEHAVPICGEETYRCNVGFSWKPYSSHDLAIDCEPADQLVISLLAPTYPAFSQSFGVLPHIR